MNIPIPIGRGTKNSGSHMLTCGEADEHGNHAECCSEHKQFFTLCGRTMVKALKMTETTPPVVLTQALVTRTRHKQRHYLSAHSMYDDVHAWTTRQVV